jgi:apolipoprotein N-acyltransferase
LLAAAVGVYGLSAAVLLVNAAVAEIGAWVWRGADGQRRWREIVPPGALIAAVAVGTVAYAGGLWRDVTGGPAFGVGLLQGNIDQAVKWDRAYQARTLDIYERLGRRAAAERPALIVWPEAAVPFFLRWEADLGRRVRAFVAETGTPALIGSPDKGEDGLLYNSAFLVRSDGEIVGRYDKRHLVPFGEYVPLQRVFFFLDKLVTGIGDFGRGQVATVFSEAGLRFSVMICYEVVFPAEVREFTQAGAGFLVNITNDAWFGRSGAPYQHLAMAAMRAVENGSYLVRAANTGVSAVIEPTGAIAIQTPIFVEAAVVGRIRAREGTTPYTRYGDVVAWACVISSVAYVVLLLRRPRWRRDATRESS